VKKKKIDRDITVQYQKTEAFRLRLLL